MTVEALMNTPSSLQTLKTKLMSNAHHNDFAEHLFRSFMRDQQMLSQAEHTSQNRWLSAVFSDALKRVRSAPVEDMIHLRFHGENFVYGSGFSGTHIGAIGYFEDINLGFVYLVSMQTNEVLFGKFSLVREEDRKPPKQWLN
jgi:hypothetical protein